MTASQIHLVTKISPEALGKTTSTEALPQNCGIRFSREGTGHLHLNNVLVPFMIGVVSQIML